MKGQKRYELKYLRVPNVNYSRSDSLISRMNTADEVSGSLKKDE